MGKRRDSRSALLSLLPRRLLGTCLGEGEDAAGVKS